MRLLKPGCWPPIVALQLLTHITNNISYYQRLRSECVFGTACSQRALDWFGDHALMNCAQSIAAHPREGIAGIGGITGIAGMGGIEGMGGIGGIEGMGKSGPPVPPILKATTPPR